MAELTGMGYHPGQSVIHGLDARFKFAGMFLWSIAGAHTRHEGLLLLSVITGIVLVMIPLSLNRILRELKFFYILLLFVLTARALTTPGDPLFARFPVTYEGLYDGLIICWRLLLIVLWGLVCIATTRSSEIKAAVEWFFKPIPFIPQQRTATMLSLLIRFIPLIFLQTQEISMAQKARGIENRKNPVYRMVKFVIPLMRRSFENADNLVFAMQARCYNEDRTGAALRASQKDWLALVIMAGVTVFFLIPR